MTDKEKILVAVVVGGVLYLVFSDAGNHQQREAPSQTAERVMGYSGFMMQWGAAHGVDPALIASVITVESSGDPNALGAAGEIGLMQILPSTGQWISNVALQQLYDPSTNIRVGATYLRYCIDQKGGNVLAGVAGYNYGPGRVNLNQRGDFVVPESVLAYVRKVMGFGDFYRLQFSQRLGTFYTNMFGSGKMVLDGLRPGAYA